MLVWLHRTENSHIPAIIVHRDKTWHTWMHHICSFYINGCFVYLKFCCDWPAISCYLTFYLIMSQLSMGLHLFDALRSPFSTGGRNHLSEMSASGVSVCFSMIRSWCCPRFVCPGSGSLRTYGWYEGNENGFLCIVLFCQYIFEIISVWKISERYCLRSCEMTFWIWEKVYLNVFQFSSLWYFLEKLNCHQQ